MSLIILDRDGVINADSPDHIRSAADWQPLTGSLEAIARLTHAGHRVVVATNQSGVGHGLISIETLNHIHETMVSEVATHGGVIEGVFFCPCHPDDGCEYRKPKPGLLLQIAERARVPLAGVPVVGDSQRDLDAALAVGARPVLVRTGNGAATQAALAAAVEVYDDLAHFTAHYLGER
ncbi:MAG: D-glycero-beta-D-manno-heptose 1,7-bisphosphate 7-phosphatase [Gammaproteobacteria bacterium]|nr:D-glycero-beta-D-manno-heptose 1,7-bisphosphate 7-phosphatase [Gammaproteobacteria bacterium]